MSVIDSLREKEKGVPYVWKREITSKFSNKKSFS
jgi:hypothetical protein